MSSKMANLLETDTCQKQVDFSAHYTDPAAALLQQQCNVMASRSPHHAPACNLRTAAIVCQGRGFVTKVFSSSASMDTAESLALAVATAAVGRIVGRPDNVLALQAIARVRSRLSNLSPELNRQRLAENEGVNQIVLTRLACAGCRRTPNGFDETFQVCGRCLKVRYCCTQCQMDHWRVHKPACCASANVRAI